MGRQASKFCNGNIGRAESLEEQRPAVEAQRCLKGNFGQNIPREHSPAPVYGEGRPHPGKTMVSALKYTAKGLIIMAYTLTSK